MGVWSLAVADTHRHNAQKETSHGSAPSFAALPYRTVRVLWAKFFAWFPAASVAQT